MAYIEIKLNNYKESKLKDPDIELIKIIIDFEILNFECKLYTDLWNENENLNPESKKLIQHDPIWKKRNKQLDQKFKLIKKLHDSMIENNKDICIYLNDKLNSENFNLLKKKIINKLKYKK
jgi:hypothetical protein